jgi:hypothetical protein
MKENKEVPICPCMHHVPGSKNATIRLHSDDVTRYKTNFRHTFKQEIKKYHVPHLSVQKPSAFNLELYDSILFSNQKMSGNTTQHPKRNTELVRVTES